MGIQHQFDGTTLVILTTQSSILSQSPAGQTHSSNTTRSPTFLLSSYKSGWNNGSRWTVFLWSGPGLGKVEPWRLKTGGFIWTEPRGESGSVNLPPWQQLTATIKPINRISTKLWEILALYWKCLAQKGFRMLKNTSLRFSVMLPKGGGAGCMEKSNYGLDLFFIRFSFWTRFLDLRFI